MYFLGEFKNILEQRDFTQLLPPWPTDDDIRTLVGTAAGLFAHPVLRHVAYPPDSQIRERLQSVLEMLSDAGKKGYTTPFSQLDALYVHIMEQMHSSVCTIPSFLLFGQPEY